MLKTLHLLTRCKLGVFFSLKITSSIGKKNGEILWASEFGSIEVASLKDTVARKDEELEHLKLLKDLGSQSPSSNSERQGRTLLLNHSSSAHQLYGMAVTKGRGLSGGKIATCDRSVSDNGNSLDFSDKHSENSSQHSLDDFKHRKEYLAQPKLAVEYRGLVQPKMAAEYRGQSSSTDNELLGLGDAKAEERLSDTSNMSNISHSNNNKKRKSKEFLQMNPLHVEAVASKKALVQIYFG